VRYLLLGAGWMLSAAMPLTWCARNEEADGNASAVLLRDAVEVNRSQVWLSDLLPRDAPSALQKASAAIGLCQAPQPGSVRTLAAEQIAVKLASQPEVLRQLAIPPRITIRNSGWPITEAAVRMAISIFLREQGLNEPGLNEPGRSEPDLNKPGLSESREKRDLVDSAKLEWLRPLSATEEHPTLQVTGLDWDNRQQTAQVRLRCSRRASCGNFLVHVVLPSPLDEEWRNRLRPGIGLNSPGAVRLAAADGSGGVLAEKGKAATLVLDGGSVRISVRVICLQQGVLNQQIRVIEERSRRVFHAEVVGAGLLRASL